MCARQLGDLNVLGGDWIRVDITGGLGVPGENDDGRRVISLCDKKWLCVGNLHISSTRVCLSTQRGLEAKME